MKNNQEAVERFDQARGAKINRPFWIAGSLENSDLKDSQLKTTSIAFSSLTSNTIFTVFNLISLRLR